MSARANRLLPLLLLLLLAPPAADAQSCARPESLTDPWNLTAEDARALAQEPGEPALVTKRVEAPGEGRPGKLSIRARVHALYEPEVEAFESAIRAIEEQDEYLPRLGESRVLCESGEPVGYARVLQALEFRFLFFQRNYEYVLHYVLEEGSSRGDSFRVWWVLEERRDEDFLLTDGSLYFESVTVGGERYTYAAYAIHTVFERERLGLRAALERFGERDLYNGLTALAEEASRREG